MNEMTRRELLAKGTAAAAGVALGLGTIRVRPAQAASKAFTYDASTIFPNPERGWFYPVPPDYYNNTTMPHEGLDYEPSYELNEQMLAQKRSEGMSLVRKYYLLYEWRSSYIPQSYFDEHLLYDFDLVRRNGFKLIPRFAYVWNVDDYDDTDATRDWILRHIDQIAPILNNNIDVLAHMEAAFIGYYGEWHTSKSGNLTSNQTLNQNSRDIYAAVMDAVPKERMVLMRYVKHLRELYPTALTASQAYDTSDQARTGMHDDSFMYDKYHRGGYAYWSEEEYQKERDYQQRMTDWAPMSGEPSGDDGSGYVFQDPISELEKMNWRMMNSDWYEARRDGVYDYWKQNDYYDEMNRRFGYRFALEGSATYSGWVRPNGTFNMSFAVRNRGFGAPYNVRLADLVVRHAATGKEYYRSMYYQIADPKRWQPGSSYPVNVSGRLPFGAPVGTYKVFLSFPDSRSMLSGDGRYSIRLANNETTWESAKGYNALNISFSVSDFPVAPDYSVPEFRVR